MEYHQSAFSQKVREDVDERVEIMRRSKLILEKLSASCNHVADELQEANTMLDVPEPVPTENIRKAQLVILEAIDELQNTSV